MCNKCNGNCNSCNCTCQEPCSSPDCACKVFITTDCVTLKEDLTCSNIPKGITETEALKLLDEYICQRFTSVENFLQLINVGNGSQIYKGISVLGKKELRTLISDGSITITQNADTISFSVNIPEFNQDNFVRNLYINLADIPDYNIDLPPTAEQINAYLSTLPNIEKTLAETDSKWNLVFYTLNPT